MSAEDGGRPLAVAMVSASFHPAFGGAEGQALELSVALRLRGLEVAVLTRRLPGLPARETVRGVPVRRLWCAGGGLINAATFLVSLFLHLWRRRLEYDAIHVHLAGSPALAAALAGRLLGKPVVVKLGGGRGVGELAASSRTWSGRLKLSALSALSPRFLAVSRDLALECARYLGPVRARVLPNGVDGRRFRPVAEAEKRAARARLGWPEEGPCFLYLGRFSPEKGLALLLDGWERLGEGPGFAALVGDGPDGPALKERAGRLGEVRALFFLPPTREVHTLYAAADVFVLPSVSEGLSNALLEAMASGLAVLATRVGGTAEAVEAGREGLLVPSGDSEAFAQAARRLIDDPELRRRLGRAAREKALKDYSLESVAAALEPIYRGLER